MSKALRVIISGGGTGGHIFPAISIANAIMDLCPDASILFIGAKGRMEMQRVPAAGYEIEGLPIRGFFRPLWKPANIGVAFDYLKSKWLAKKILREFKPDVAVGVGGYASSALPTVWASPRSSRSRTAMPVLPTSSWRLRLRRSVWLMKEWNASSPPTRLF